MATNIKITAIEVNQAIQHLGQKNSVLLVHGKNTYIRLYCKVTGKDLDNQMWSADLHCHYKDASGKKQQVVLAPTKPVYLEEINTDINSARLQWNATLSFALHDSDLFAQTINSFQTNESTLELKLDNIKTRKDSPCKCSVSTLPDKEIIFHAPVTFHCRAIGYSYQDPETGDITEPTASELNLIRDYIEAAFPVSNIEWSTNAIEAPASFTQVQDVLNENNRAEEKIDLLYQLMFQHLLALRARETGMTDKNSIDPRTLYIGILSDPTNRFGGASMDSPDYPTPHVIAFAESQSDGDLAAHEISHLLGCEHPGIPDKKLHGRLLGQSNQTGLNAREMGISATGQIAHPDATSHDNRLIGLREQRGSHEPLLLDSTDVFEVTSYRLPAWVSQNTYENLYRRLSDIQALPIQRVGKNRRPACNPGNEKYLNLIGAYNLTERTAEFNFTIESDIPLGYRETFLMSNPDGDIEIDSPLSLTPVPYHNDCNSPDEKKQKCDKSEPIYVRHNHAHTDTNFSVGVFQHTLKKTATVRDTKLEIKISDNPADTLALPSLGYPTRQGLLGNPLVIANPSLVKKITDADFSALDSYVTNTGKKASCTNDINIPDYIKFQFNVQESSLFLNYDWTITEPDEADIRAFLKAVISDKLNSNWMLFALHFANVPMTTAFELKYPKPKARPIAAHNAAVDNFEDIVRWETAYISNRVVNNKVWVPHRYVIQSLGTYARGGSGFPVFQPTVGAKPDDRRAEFDLQCRIILIAAGQTINLFQSTSPLHAAIVGTVSGTHKNDGQDTSSGWPPLAAARPNDYDNVIDYQPL